MKRCIRCSRRIWPWQRLGWYYITVDKVFHWHARCREAVAWHELPDA